MVVGKETRSSSINVDINVDITAKELLRVLIDVN